MVALGGGLRRGCAALLELRKRMSEERERALLSSSAMRKKREDDAGKMCEEVGSASKNRKVLRISLHSRFVPWAVSCSVLLLAYLLVFLQC